MSNDNRNEIAKIRIERADELLKDAKLLLEKSAYKSANNRAFYAAEKAIKSALSTKGMDSDSHVKLLRAFNMAFIHEPSVYFSREDLSLLQGMERIRNASDYDDFYITSKSECEDQVKKAGIIIDKVKRFLQAEDIV